MRRGTTPSVSATIKGFPFGDIDNLYFTFCNGQTVIEFEKSDVEIDAANEKITVKLTQEQTLSLDPAYGVQFQIRFKMADGSALCSAIKETSVTEILKDGVI